MVLLVLPRMPKPITTITQHEDSALCCSLGLSNGSDIHDLSCSSIIDETLVKNPTGHSYAF